MNKKRICENLKKLRMSQDYTQKYIGNFLEIEQNTYCLKESGKVAFKIDEISKLADLYQVKIDDIVNKQIELKTEVKILAI